MLQTFALNKKYWFFIDYCCNNIKLLSMKKTKPSIQFCQKLSFKNWLMVIGSCKRERVTLYEQFWKKEDHFRDEEVIAKFKLFNNNVCFNLLILVSYFGTKKYYFHATVRIDVVYKRETFKDFSNWKCLNFIKMCFLVSLVILRILFYSLLVFICWRNVHQKSVQP
jgi:hypothetical protein